MVPLFRLVVLAFASTLLVGCAASQPQMSPELQAAFDQPLICEGEEQCQEYWERAAFFVSSNAGFKIQTQTDMLIETYNPSQYSVSLAFSISREPLGNGRYQIWTKAWCDNLFGCTPNQYEATARAKRYIRTGIK